MKCCGASEGCECIACLGQRMEEQHRWENYQQEQYDEWEASYWAGVEEDARQRREALESWKTVDEEPF